MGNRNKKNNKRKSEELGTESITHSETSKQINALNQNNKKTQNKKLSDGKNYTNTDFCHGEPKEDNMNKVLTLKEVNQKTKNKQKKRKVGEDVETINVEPRVKEIKTNEGNKPSAMELKLKNTKIVFDDGAGSPESLVNSNKNKYNFLNKDEAEVKDEDIDKFCDEITDEDNKTYENWVQLFEANFKKSKKTTT